MDRLLVTSSLLSPRPTFLVALTSVLPSPALSIIDMNYLGNCGHPDQFLDSQKILRAGESHGRKEYTQEVSPETLLLCSVLDLHMLSEVFLFSHPLGG